MRALLYFKQSTAGFTTSRQEIGTSETTSAVDDHPSSRTTNFGGLPRPIRNLSYKNWRWHLVASISPLLPISTISVTENFNRDGPTSTDRRHKPVCVNIWSHYSSNRIERNSLSIWWLVMKSGSSTKIMYNMPSGFHATQSRQQTRSRTSSKQTSSLRLVEHKRANIVWDASCGHYCHSYRLRQSASKIVRRNSRKMTKMLNCSLATRQRATTHRFGHSSENRRAWLAPGYPSTILAGHCSTKL